MGLTDNGLNKRVLLLVEDDDATAFLLESALRDAAINVALFRVRDGFQALAFLRKGGDYLEVPKPDLVLLDLNLPRKGGLEVLSELKREGQTGSLEVVVFTSSSLAIDRRNSLALGARQYITKPASYAGFVDAVKSACAHLANSQLN